MKKKNIGLALGAGGVKGLAHLGVLRVLEDKGVPINYIAGSSIGALVGAMYAVNPDIRVVEKFFEKFNSKSSLLKVLDFSSGGGVIEGKRLKKFLQQYFKNKTFKDTIIPLRIIATDLNTLEQVVLNKGTIAKAVLASIAAPPVMSPEIIDGRYLSDGGLVNPLPCDVVRKMGAHTVIAVNLENGFFEERLNKKNLNLSSLGHRAMGIMRYAISSALTDNADVLIEPLVDNQIIVGFTEFFKKSEMEKNTRLGEEAARKKLRQIAEFVR